MSGFDHYFVLRNNAVDHELIYRSIFTHQFDTVKTELLDRMPHLSDENDPHELTGAQVGLDQIQNQGVASEYDAREAARSDVYLDLQGAHAFVRTKFSPISGVAVPEGVAPTENTVLATQQPELSATAYGDFWNEPRLHREFEVSVLGTAFSEVVWRGEMNADRMTVDAPLPGDSAYEWRCRDIPTHGLPGGWSAAGRFTVPDVSLKTPVLTGPVGDAPLTGATFTTDAFGSPTGDTHHSSTWRLWRVEGSAHTEVWASENDAVHLTNLTLSTLLQPNATYLLTVRHVGTVMGESDQAMYAFTTVDASVTAPAVTVDDVSGAITATPTLTFAAFGSTGYDDTLAEVRVYLIDGGQQTLLTTQSDLTPYTLPTDLTSGKVYSFTVIYRGAHLGDSVPTTVGPFTVLARQSVLYTFPPSLSNNGSYLSSALVLDDGTRVYGGRGRTTKGVGAKLVAVNAQGHTVFNQDEWFLQGAGETMVRNMTTDGVNIYTVHLDNTQSYVKAHNPDGTLRWAKAFTVDGAPRTIAIDILYANGTLYVVGYHNATGFWLGFVAQLRTDGTSVMAIQHRRRNIKQTLAQTAADVGDGVIVVSNEGGYVVWTKYSYDLSTILYTKRKESPHASDELYFNARVVDGVLHLIASSGLFHVRIDATTGALLGDRKVSRSFSVLVDALPLPEGRVLYTHRRTSRNALQPSLTLVDAAGAVLWSVCAKTYPDVVPFDVSGRTTAWDGSGVLLALYVVNDTVAAAYIDPNHVPGAAVNDTTLGFDPYPHPTIDDLTIVEAVDIPTPIGESLTTSWVDATVTDYVQGPATEYDL